MTPKPFSTHSPGSLTRLVIALLAAGLLLLAQQPAPAFAYPLWTITDVDQANGPTSIALDDAGHPHIAYVNYRRLDFAAWDGGAWRITEAAPTTMCVYEYADISLALNADSTRAAVSFYDICAKVIKVAIGTKAPAGTWSWIVESIPAYANGNYNDEVHSSAIAFDNGNGIHLAFNEDANVYYARRTSSWMAPLEVTDSAHSSFWKDVSLTLDSSSKPHIGFDNGSARLSYARPASTGGSWIIEDVATAGGGHALALDGSNMALIAFHDSAARSLKYARRTGVNAWTITTIDAPDAADTAGDAGKYPSLALDTGGNPRVGYHYAYLAEDIEGAVKYATWDGSAWQNEWVEVGYWGRGISLALDSANAAHFSYFVSEGSNARLHYATRSEGTGDSPYPDTIIDSGPARLTTGLATFTFHSDDSTATFQCRDDTSSWLACTSPRNESVGADGYHAFWVRAVNAGGVVDPSPAYYTWLLDTTDPNSYIISGPPSPSDSPDATFEFNATDKTAVTFRCRVVPEVYVPGDVWPNFQPCTSPKSFTGIDDGDWVFELMATDAAGNEETYHDAAFDWWTIDLPGPSTTITAKPPALTNSTSAAFTFTSNETAATFECSLNGAAYSACTSPKSYTVNQATHTFQVRAVAGGVTDPVPASYTWVVDTTPPTVSIGDKPPISDQFTTATFTFTSNDAAATFECQLNSGGYTACATPKTFTGLITGNYTFNVRAIDPAGNMTPNPAAYSWYTAGPPQTSIYYPDPLPVYTTSTSISFLAASSKAGGSYQCRLDGGAFAACADGNGQSYTNLTPGRHTFSVRAIDSLSQTDPTPASHTWIIDPYWPDTRIDGAPANPSNSNAPRFLFSSGSAGATFECQMDSGGWSACTSPKNYTALSNAAHTFAVRATSGAGIVDPTPATYTWTIAASTDATPPDTTITAQPANPANSARATFAFTSNDAAATFECSLDAAAFAPCVSPVTYAGLYSRDHTFKVRARDDAGNVDASPAQVSWNVQFGNDPDVLALGQFHGCALRPDGSVDCWGSNASDQPGPYTAIAANDYATCGLRPDGSVDCWGNANNGGVDQAGPFTQISGGAYSFCGVKSDNSVACWGWNANGQAANQTGPYTLVSGGTAHTCALNTAGAITCWGDNSSGQRSAPTGAFYRLVSGYTHSCAMKSDGSVDCWGYNAYGQNADQAGPFAQLTAGNDHNCALKSDGSVDCWGRNDYGQAADQPGPYVAVAAGGHFTCALRADGSVDCWGINPDGRADDQPGPFGPPTLDTFAPDTIIDSGPAANTEATDAAFTFRGNEAGATFECALDSAAFAACTSPQNYTGLATGAHSFQVRATDAAGNSDATPAEHNWTINAPQPPETTITSAPATLANSASASFAFSSSETGSTFQCALDGVAFAACTSPKSYSGLSDGSHTFQVKAIDSGGTADPTPAGHTWTIDTTPPDTTITQSPSNPSTSSGATFAFSSETGATFECQLDGSAFAACTSSKSYTGLTDASHTFNVRAKDAAGNLDPSPAGYTWTIDATPPDTTITGKPEASTSSTSATFTFTGVDAVSFECQLDSQSYVACTSPKQYDGLNNGSHTFNVRAKDTEGRYDPSPAGFTWTIDAAAPETTITLKPAAISNDPTPDFAFTSNDPNPESWYFYCQTDANGWFPCGGSSITYYNLFEGDHTFSVKAEDAQGNVDPTPATWSWTMDLTAPETTITVKPAAISNSAATSFQFTSEDGATFECQLDSGSYAACTSPKNYTGLSDGSHTFSVRAKDAAGNVDASPAGYTWAIDTTPPETTITAHPDALTNSATAAFSFTGVGAASFECKLDSGGFVACTSPVSYTGLYNGSHTFHVWAIDAAGNYDTSTASYTWTVDTNPPETTISGKPAATTNSTTAEFTFTGVDVASFECKLDTAAFAACTSPKSYTGLTGGSHTFNVRAKDAAGNYDPSPATYTWTIDTAAPDTTLTQTPPNPSNSSSATFAFSSEAGATFECQYDSGSFATCTSPKSYTGLTDGSHTFGVRAKDAAGNVDASPATFAWVIDTTPPDTTLLTTPPNPAPGSSAQFTFSSDAGATFACRLDGAAYAACTSPQNYTGLAVGSHTFNVQATDAAGNTDPTPAGYTWTVPTPTTLTVVKETNPSGGANFPFMLTPGAVSYVNKIGGPTAGSDSGKFDRPDGMAVDAAGNIYVADTYNFRIQKFDATGAFLAAWGWDVIAANGVTTYEICVAGQTCKIGVLGGGKGQFSSPRGVALDTAGNVYVADYGNNRIQQFSSTGIFIATWGWDVVSGGITTFEICTATQNCKGGTAGGGAGQFNLPFGLILDVAGNVYVVDYNNHRIQKFNALHAFVLAWGWDVLATGTVTTYEVCTATQTCKAGVSGGGNGQFKSPYAIALDGAGNVYVGDLLNNRIEKFTDAGVFIAAWGQDVISGNAGTGYEVCTATQTCKAGVAGSGKGSFNYTPGVAADEAGNVYVVDFNNNRIEMFDAAGTFVLAWGWDVATGGGTGFEVCTAEQTCKAGVSGTGDGQFYRPDGVALGGTNVYVVDTNNHRVQKFRQTLLVLDDSESDTYGDLVAGAYVLRELVPAGWVLTDIACDGGSPAESGNNVSLTLATGDQVTCTFTNALPDTTPPETAINSAPAVLTNDNDPSFTFSGDDGSGWGVASFECKLDAAAYAACTSPQSYTDLSDGSHTFEVRAVDEGDNFDATAASHTWTIDATAPDTTLTGQPPALTTSQAAEFTFSSEEGATFECKLDSNSFSTCTSPQSYTGLSEGSHTFNVRARDAAGNVDASPAGYTWTIDTIPPTITIDFTTVLPGSIHFTVNFTEPVNGFANGDVTLSGTAGATTAIVTNLHDRMEFDLAVSGMTGDGTISLAIAAGVATDAAGNGNTAATFTWTIETPGPDTSLDSYPPNPSNSPSATFTFSGAGALSFECSLDDASFADCASPHVVTGLAEGPHQFVVRAVNGQGKVDDDPPVYDWTVDVTAPTATITHTSGHHSPIHFTARFTEAMDGFISQDVTLGGTAGATTVVVTNIHHRMEFDLAVSGMTGDGTISLAIAAGVATDAAGNGNTAATLIWTIDTTGPAVTITGAPSDPSASNSATFTFTSEQGATFWCSLDDADFDACASPQSYSGLSDGSHTFNVQATDAAGNTGAAATHSWNIDTTPPDTTITAKPDATTNSTSATFTFTGDDAASFECQLDSDAYAACTSPQTYTSLSDGSHAFNVRAMDAEGRYDPSPAGYSWTIDTAGPETTITTKPAADSNDPSPEFAFTSDEPGVSFKCQIDAAPWAACNGGAITYDALNEGDHTFLVQAVDSLGNEDPTPAEWTWTIDLTPPETTIDSWIGDVYTVDIITIEFSSEAGATFQCALDGAAWSDCASPMTYNYLADGAHTFQVRATDAAGNTDPTPAAGDWTVATPGPDTSLDSWPTDPSNSRAATFTFSGGDAAAFECSLDGDTFTICDSPHEVTGLIDGPHLFEVRAVTSQGKVDDSPAGYGWLVDATAPGATIQQASGQPDPTDSGPIHFTVLFTEPVNDFTAEDVTVTGATGTTTVVVTNLHDHMEYDVAVSGMTNSCTVFAAVAAGVASDAAGNANTAATTTDNSVAYDAGPPPTLYVTAAGGTANNDTEADVLYTKGDILKWDGAQWTKWFSSAAQGLNPLADLIAFDVIDDAGGSAWLVWRQTLTIRGLGRVMGHDITHFDGQTLSLFFDGSDVGLTLAGERIDGLEVLPGDGQCRHRLLISTVAGGSVRQGTNPTITFTGEDVLSFCMTSEGMGTTGTWTLLEELQSEGLGRNNSLDIATAGDATDRLYFVPKKVFTLDGATVKPSEIALFDRTTRHFCGPLWSAKAHGLSQLVDGIDVMGSLPD